MGSTGGCRYWSILQVVAIILCYRGSASYITGERPEEGDSSTIPVSESNIDETENVILEDTINSADERSTDNESRNHELETTTYEIQTTIQEDATYSTADEQSTGGDVINSVADPESTTETPVAGIVICCLIIVLIIIITVYALYQWRKNAQAKPNETDANAAQGMTEVYNRSKKADVDAQAAQGTSQQYNDDPFSLYTLIEETPAATYSDVRQTDAISKDGQSERVATDKAKAVTETQAMELNVYSTLDKPSTTTSTYSALEADQGEVNGLAENGDCSPDKIYSLASNATEDNSAVDSPAQLQAGTI